LGNILIYNKKIEEEGFLSKLCQKLGPVYTSSTLEKTVALLKSMPFSTILVDSELADDRALKELSDKTLGLILTGREEEALKEMTRHWPADRFVDYLMISPRPVDITRGERVLKIAQDFAHLKSNVESLTLSKGSLEKKLKKFYAELKSIGSALSEGLAKELEKRIALEARYLHFQKLKENFENILRKLYAANDVNNLLDIVFDIKDLVRARGISLYILEENDTLGKYLKPLVWDDAFLSHADFAKHVALFLAQDFAATVARTGEEINLANAASDPGFSGRYRQLRAPLYSLLCTPLKYDQVVIGAIEVYDKSADDKVSQGGFSQEDRQIMRGLSEHISIAMTKLNLIQFDALTGLLRPDPFFEKVIQKIESQGKRRQEVDSYAMAMGDVDWFKNYNDRNGHEAGNRLLRELAGVLRSSIREDDILCRYGGEEFLFFLAGVKNIEEATLLTERIRRNIEDHYFEHEEFQPRHNLTMSFGVTIFPRKELTAPGAASKTLLKKIAGEADMALAEAKGKRFKNLPYNENLITKNKVCAYVRDKATVMGRTGVIQDREKLILEKRKSERYYASTLCIYNENGGHKVATTVDLSLGGTKISSETQFPLAKTVDFFLILGSRANLLRGDVVYSQQASPHSSYFYTGLKFKDLSPEDKKLLETYFHLLEKKDVQSI
jgi:diguanylate cyclase (GGDEF)-like protein